MIFAVLSTDRAAQTVRVHRGYMPLGFDPLEHSLDDAITDAVVTISESGTTYLLRDTLILRPDTSRYKFPLHMYVLSPFTPQNGKSFNLSVESRSLGSASASVIVPGRVSLALSSHAHRILSRPESQEQVDVILFEALIADVTKGYIGRMFIDYSVLKGAEWIEERVEVPLDSPDRKSYSLDRAWYPQLSPRSPAKQVSVAFLQGFYRAVITDLAFRKYPSEMLIFNRVVFQFLQAERNLYNYYAVAHGFRDAQSMRLDEPTYSNISGGVGLFGAYTLDSLVYILPENFSGNRR